MHARWWHQRKEALFAANAAIFFKEITTFIQQGGVKLIKSDIEDI